MKEIEVTIKNWHKYQKKRRDVEHTHWFRVKDTMWRDEKFYDFTCAEKIVWYSILGHAAEKNSDKFILRISWFLRAAGVSKKDLLSAMAKLARTDCVTWTLRERNEDVPSSVCREEKKRIEEKRKEYEVTKKRGEAPLTPPPKIGSNEFIGVYVTAYQARYGSRPVLDGKALGLVKNLLKHIPVQTAMDLIQVYLQIDDHWFKTKYHDLVTFSNNLNKISACLQTGKEKPAEEQNWNKFWNEVDASESKKLRISN